MAIFSSDIVTSAISASIADTAVDVFVYDTSKDSDGGAWRKRTQNTSWYNETLGTATRGSRKEFPAVAVIVAEATKVTIYDGDDPDLPMWMTFEPNGIIDWPTSNVTKINISALNGILTTVTNDGGHLFKFVEDYVEIIYSSQNYNISSGRTIADRNDSTSYATVSGTALRVYKVVTYNMNDVAMTVLPNATVDSATGLPIPTIAVATDGGISFLLDNGTVANNIRGTNEVKSISFDKDNSAIFSWGTSSGAPRHITRLITSVWRVASSSSSLWPNNYFSSYNEGLGNSAANFDGAASGVVTVANSGRHFGIEYATGNTNDRLGILHPKNLTNYADQNLSAFIASSYNTGYMHGDVKGAFLSDTDTTNVVGGGDGLITGNDSTFGAVITSLNWSERSGSGGGWNVSGGVLKTGTVSSGEYLDITTSGYTSGQTYVISYTLANVTGSNPLRIRFNNGQMDNLPTSNGSHSHYITLTETGTLFSILNDSSLTADIDNFKLQLVQDEDRSVNNNGLAVYGTITKENAVATGADLVAYSGFSASNYLKQPFNSDLAPGTEAYSVSCWFKTGTSSVDQYIFDRNGGGAGSRNLLLIMNTSAGNANSFQWWHRDNTGNVTDIQITDKTITDNVWHQVVALNDGSNYRVYVDGEVSSVTSSVIRNVINDNDPPMFIGVRHTEESPMTGSMALLRYSKSAPSPEQIKKIYEDEKVLFQENAKATLYGSSDAVTALAYDDTTELLHVGTSSGRSDFQGLRRINNTTDPVTTAISAHDSLIIEQ